MRRTVTLPCLRFACCLLLSLGGLLSPARTRAQAVPPGQGLVADSTELRVLREFYFSTNGDQWINRANWPTTPAAWATVTLTDAATWAGLTAADGDIVSLDFFSNNVSGYLKPSLGLLTGLRTLHFERSHFGPQDAPALGGELPKELSQLQHLETLNISYCEVTGHIPPEFGQLTQLRNLTLLNDHLDGPIPPELGNLTQLVSLQLDNYFRVQFAGHRNVFTGGIPRELGHLANLTYLALDMNALGGEIPHELANLTNLSFLELDDTGLTGTVPLDIIRLPYLTTVLLGAANYGPIVPNTLSRLPAPSQLPNLGAMQLQLWYNQFGFDALEPYFDGPGHMRAAAGSTYLPQTQPLLPTASLSITVQQPARFDARRDSALQGNYTHYQWQREVNGDWQTVAGATAATYALAAAAPADAGRYRCQATNDWVTGLTLYSRVYVLTVDELEAGPRNLPDDTNQGMALAQPHAPADSAATAPVDMNYVRTWVPRVALRHASNQASPGQCTATGQILREEWDNAPGTEVSQIPLTSVPGSFSYLTALEGPTNCGDNYGDRIRGYLCPPQTGNYTFWIAGDDTSELWVSTDDDPTHKVNLATVPAYTDPRQWTKYPQQQSAAVALVAGRRYYVEVLHKEGGGGDNVAVAWRLPDGTIEGPISGSHLSPAAAPVLATAAVLREEWDNIAGTQVSQIPLNSPATSRSYMATLEGPTNSGDNYGDRMRAYLTAPQTGQYTFWIAGDDNSQLWLSPDDSPAHKVNLATVPGYTDPRQWDKYPEQQSALISLVAGQRYYVEVLHKEGGGGDNVAVAWRLPDGTIEGPILGSHLSPLPLPAPGAVLREQWSNVSGTAVTDIPLTQPPTSTGYVATLEGLTGQGDNYGDRLRAYLTAPLTGSYTFWIASDDNSVLWLSPDESPSHKVRLDSVVGVTAPRQWDKYPSQQSAPVSLVAGQRYYVEVLHKQGGGSDHVSVAWQLPDGTQEGPIASSHLAPAGPPLTVLAAGNASTRGSTWTVDSASLTTQYLDGLGRPVQTVQHQASPQRRDLVQPQAYDGLGREPRAYLSYAGDTTGTGSLGYHYRGLTQQQQFYLPSGQQGPPTPGDPTAGVARTGAAYADTWFEASPLNRVLQQGAPGEAWQLTAGHASQRVERVNVAQDSVPRFAPSYATHGLDPGYQGYYLPGELWSTQLTDENGYRSLEWKDRLGQTVLKQVEAGRQGASSRWLRTTYAYDDFGHLRFVLQPEATRRVLATPVSTLPPVGYIWREQWTNIGGAETVDQLPLNGAPTSISRLTSLEGPTHYAKEYGDRIRGFLVPPQTGNYTFWIAGDNESVFYLSTDQSAAHIQLLAQVQYPGLTLPREWTKYPAQKSSQVQLVAGQRYYLEVRHKQGEDDDNLAVTWQLPDGSQFGQPIAGAYLTPLTVPTPVLTADLLAAIQPYTFHYRYDSRGRQVAKQVPGQDGETLVVYDQLDRPVLSQDAQQRTRKEWSWSKYDALGRLVLSGLVTRADTAGQVSLQNVATADTAAAHQYEQRTAQAGAYPQYYTTDQSFPKLGQQGFGVGQVLSVSYYDDYDFDNNGQADAQYDPSQDGQFPSGAAPVADAGRTTGMPTRTKTRVLGVAETTDVTQPAAWLTTTTFYDERARPVQVQSTNARRGTDLLTTQLDFPGKVVQSVTSHQGPGLAQPLVVREFFRYDHADRLLSSRQQLPGEVRPARLDSVIYNELGQVTRKTLGTGRLQQEVDYAYNIRGWLTSLNNPYVPDPRDLFSLSLHYEAGFTKGYEQYTGNLTGQTWRGRDGVQRAQGYVYDLLNRLLQGDFVARTVGANPSTGAWTQELDNYRLSFVSYDDNGNINTLRRRGLLQAGTSHQAKQYGVVDNLTYAYQGNRLQAVDDAVSGNQLPQPASYHGAPTSLAGDFQEAGVKLGQEYLYDANGNLTVDKNKGITGILYNHLNLPRQIHFGSVGDSVVFRYAASGQKVAKLVYQTGKPTPQRTDYLGPYQYEQDSLKFFPHAEGRVLRFVQYDAARQPTVSYQREFTVKDHLGNLRLAYRAGQIRTLLATLEQDESTHKRESQQFDSLSVSAPVAQATSWARSGAYAARLNAGGSAPQPLGPLTQLGVQKGDTVTVTAFGLYPQAQQHGFLFSLGSFLASLFHPASPPPPGFEVQKRKDLPLLQVGVAAGLASIPQLSGGVPQAYLRVLVFNRDSALVPDQPAPVQLTQAAQGNYERLSLQLVLPQDGYVTAYVGSQSDVDVFFDDVRVEHRPGLQVQETQYDPAGLELAGLGAPSPGIRGLNNYRFNGKEFQPDLGLAWNHQDWRFLDPQLLRWHSGDPEIENGQESWSPYSFGYDNAVRYADANGREPGDGDPPSAAGIIVNTFVGIGVSLVNTVLMAGDALGPGGYAVAVMSGNSTRASNNGDGSVSYGKRSVPTSGRELAGYVGADLLDGGSAALTGATLGSGGLVSGELPMAGGYLFEQGASKVIQNEAVQEGKRALSSVELLRTGGNNTTVNVKTKSEANSLLNEAFPKYQKVNGVGSQDASGLRRKAKMDRFKQGGAYHKDYAMDPETGRVRGHEPGNPHGEYPHINVKRTDGKKVLINVTGN